MSVMGQTLDGMLEQRVPYDEDSDNGLILGGKYLPEELIAEILCYVDYKSLLNAQLVCKRWKALMHSYVWRKKAESTLGRSLKTLKNVDWQVFYVICKKKPFERNLVKNNSGQEGVRKHWNIICQGGDHWKVECPPQGVNTPATSEELFFEGKQYCFVTSYHTCSKKQTIKLSEEGLTSQILDKLQPPIVVSEWYSCRWDCPAIYECCVKLLGKNKQILDSFEFRVRIENELQDQWHRISHVFTNYGPGLEEITFLHRGIDNLFWAGHYGSKMAGASVIVKLPEPQNSENEDTKVQSSNSQPEAKIPRYDSSDSIENNAPTNRIFDIDGID